MRIDLPAAAATERFGACLAKHSAPPFTIWLEGDLGSGKTTFCRGLIRALGHPGRVKSPTYSLLETYELPETTVFHLDLYRLADGNELRSAGLADCFAERAILLVEWPQRATKTLPQPDIHLRFLYDGDARTVAARVGKRGKQGATALEAAVHAYWRDWPPPA